MTVRQEDDITITNPISPKDNNATKEEKSRRRILFLSLEFNYAPFSGNGVLARSLVSSLVTRSQKKEGGGDCEVRVICGRPHSSVISLSKDICMRSSLNAKTNDRNNELGDNVDDGDSKSDLEIWPIDLPQKCQWKRLDRFGPWEEFASACGSGGFSEQSQFVDRVREFQPTDVVAVDWHGMLAWESICRAFYMSGDENENDGGGEVSWQPSCANVCYYNFRVYSASSWEHADSGEEETCDNQLFYHEKEQLSCRLADAIICLAEHDRGTLQRLVEEDGDTTTISCEELPTNERRRRSVKDIHILHPPLRGDIWELASSMADIEDTIEFNQYLPTEIKDAIQQSPIASEHQQRMLITCCARLSPEKSPHHFTALLQQLGGIDFLRRRSLIPVICGARSVEGYAEKVVTDFQSFCSKSSSSGDSDGYSWPCVVIDHHLGPKELAAVFSHTVVNVHPCLYDAYGMTLVESAAFGAPSIVNGGGKVGATALLGEGEGCIAVDMEHFVKESHDDDGDSSIRQATIESIQELLISGNYGREEELPEKDGSMLGPVAKEGRSRALGWDEMACCRGLINVLDGLQ